MLNTMFYANNVNVEYCVCANKTQYLINTRKFTFWSFSWRILINVATDDLYQKITQKLYINTTH